MAGIFDTLKKWATVLSGSDTQKKSEMKNLEVLELDRLDLIKAFKERLSDPKALSFTGAHADALFNFHMSCEDLGHTEEESRNMISKLLEDVIAAGGYPKDSADNARKELQDYYSYKDHIRSYGEGKDFDEFVRNDQIKDSYQGMSDKELLALIDRKARNLEKMDDLTYKQAKMLQDSGIWKKWTPQQLVTFQVFQSHLSTDIDSVKAAASKMFGRTISYFELPSKKFREEVDRKIPLANKQVSTDAGKQVGRGWAGLINGAGGEKSATVAIGKEQTPVSQQAPQTDAEKTLHDNFEELMKESEKEQQSRGIKR